MIGVLDIRIATFFCRFLFDSRQPRITSLRVVFQDILDVFWNFQKYFESFINFRRCRIKNANLESRTQNRTFTEFARTRATKPPYSMFTAKWPRTTQNRERNRERRITGELLENVSILWNSRSKYRGRNSNSEDGDLWEASNGPFDRHIDYAITRRQTNAVFEGGDEGSMLFMNMK